MNRMRDVACFVTLCVTCALPALAFAIAGTDKIAEEGTSVSKQQAESRGWPDGVLDLVNDPLRTEGWNPWFSELPNDVDHYAMKARTTEEVQHLIDLLARIKTKSVRLQLDPGKEPSGVGTARFLEDNGIAVMFLIGSQKMINEWFKRLPETEPGVRKFGVHQYKEPLEALSPTLTLYVANEAIDLGRLKVPVNFLVEPGFSEAYRKQHKDDAMIARIDRYVAEHKAKQKAAADKAKGGQK